MKKSTIKRGVAVATNKLVCVACGNVVKEIIVLGTDSRIEESHNKAVGYANELCEKCKKATEEYLLLVGIDTEKSDLENLPLGAYRTGTILQVKKGSPLSAHILQALTTPTDSGVIFCDKRVIDIIMKKTGADKLIKNKTKAEAKSKKPKTKSDKK